MKTKLHPALLYVLLLSSPAFASPTASTPPQGFTAQYQVQRNGEPLGTATMLLKRDGNLWLFRTRTRAAQGLAKMLGLAVNEESRFRMFQGRAEAVHYRYQLSMAFRKDHRLLDVDWASGQTMVDDDGEKHQYAAVHGMVDRHMVAWILARRLPSTNPRINVLVATRNRTETHHYRIDGSEPISTPLGRKTATRIVRSDPDREFSAWYVADTWPVPVQLQHNDFSMQLLSFQATNEANGLDATQASPAATAASPAAHTSPSD